MKQYLKRTWKNKLVALWITLPCLVPYWLDRDITLLLIMLIVAIPLFFTKKNFIE